MTKSSKTRFKQPTVKMLQKKYKFPDDVYREEVEALSYKQLLRISSAVSATSDNEKAASKLFYHSLTPPEMRVAKSIQQESNVERRSRKVKILHQCLRMKNQAELVDVDINTILQDAKKDPLL